MEGRHVRATASSDRIWRQGFGGQAEARQIQDAQQLSAGLRRDRNWRCRDVHWPPCGGIRQRDHSHARHPLGHCCCGGAVKRHSRTRGHRVQQMARAQWLQHVLRRPGRARQPRTLCWRFVAGFGSGSPRRATRAAVVVNACHDRLGLALQLPSSSGGAGVLTVACRASSVAPIPKASMRIRRFCRIRGKRTEEAAVAVPNEVASE